MALVICPDCKKQISDQAEKCIGCGRPMKESKEKIMAEVKIKLEELRQAKNDLDSDQEYYDENPRMAEPSWWEGHYSCIKKLEDEIKSLKNKL